MSRPNDLPCLRRHVSHDWGVSLLVCEDSLNVIKFHCVVVENRIVFGGQVVFQGISFESVFEFVKELERVFDVSEAVEVVIDEVLKFSVEVADVHHSLR